MATPSQPKPRKPGSRPVVSAENIYPIRPVPRYVFFVMLGIGLALLVGSGWMRVHNPYSIPKYVFLTLMMVGLAPIWIAFSTEQLRIEVGKQWLEIHGDLFYKKVLADDLLIDQAEIVDLRGKKSDGLTLRIWGAKLPGYITGWYWNKSLGWKVMLVTDRRAVLRIPTRFGWVILVSLTKNEELLARLQKYASRPAPSAEGSEPA